MGCFTTIIHPEDGRELQIKTGDDDLDRYSLGDTVDWKVYEDNVWSSKLLDGVYESCSHVKGDDDFVVIKNHTVHAIVPREVGADLYVSYVAKTPGVPPTPMIRMTEEMWEQVFDIQEPDIGLWTWEARRQNELTATKYALISAIERYADAVKDMGRTAVEAAKDKSGAMSKAVGDFIWERLGQTSFAKQLFMTDKERKLTPSSDERLHQKLLDKVEMLKTTISKEDIKIWDKSAYDNNHRF